MASYWQNLRKPLANTSFIHSKTYSSAIVNKGVKSTSSISKGLHVTARNDYPQAEALPLPINIDPSESMRFSPQRARDISSTAIATNVWNQRYIDITIDSSQYGVKSSDDPHVGSYDCTGAVSLNSSMQSNVPSPFGGMHKFTHLNMPGGQWSQSSKWMSHDLHSSHYHQLRREVRQNMQQNDTVREKVDLSKFMLCHLNARPNQQRMYSDKKSQSHELEKKNTDPNTPSTEPGTPSPPVALSSGQKLKNAIKDYGATVLVFHIAISIVSLGLFYQLVNSGLDVVGILEYFGLNSTSSTITNNVASGASTFVVAYAVHKVFAPFRISITLVSAPFIVRFLRNKGILAAKPTKKTINS